MEARKTTRYPVVSGLFYPDDPDELRVVVQRYIDDVNIDDVYGEISGQTGLEKPESIRPLGIIVPHAGYIFSGRLQAISYCVIKEFPVDTFVILGPAHQKIFKGISVNLDEEYVIPIGRVEVDREVAESILSYHKKITNKEDAHLSEHSIEVQLPFIKLLFPKAKIVSILFGEQTIENAEILKEALINVFARIPRNYMMVVSTDLSHYHTRGEAVKLDSCLMDDLRAVAPEKLYNHIMTNKAQACGYGGILTVLMLSRDKGMSKSAVLSYMDSGRVSGDRRKVVGYVSCVIY